MFLNKIKFYLGLTIINFGLIRQYRYLKKTDKLTLKELRELQDEKLKKIIEFNYCYIPYYRKIFDKLNLNPSDIASVKDLNKLPILTKSDIINNIDDFYSTHNNPVKYSNVSTGGSTGKPLKYRMSKDNTDSAFAILLRGWSLGGYETGDKVAFIAGGSLVGRTLPFKLKIVDYVIGFRRYSSYGMSNNLLKKYAIDMISWQPKFIRGYASAIFLFADYVQKNNLEKEFNIKGIFTTSEMLFDKQRDLISKVFNCDVFDTYGLNDGAISAFECKEHIGMHIDMERGILEIVNKDGSSVVDDESGLILATTLNEYSMPLLRYDTGDIGSFSKVECRCTVKRPLLTKLKGRVTDVLEFNNILISSPIITVLMGQTNALQYQFIQTGINKLIIKILKGKEYTDKDTFFIRKSLFSQVGSIKIDFEYVDSFIEEDGKKHKFIINEVETI